MILADGCIGRGNLAFCSLFIFYFHLSYLIFLTSSGTQMENNVSKSTLDLILIPTIKLAFSGWPVFATSIYHIWIRRTINVYNDPVARLQHGCICC